VCCVKEVLVFNDFDREVMVAGWYPEGETQSLRIVSSERRNKCEAQRVYDVTRIKNIYSKTKDVIGIYSKIKDVTRSFN
jgi:hypothetical protein